MTAPVFVTGLSVAGSSDTTQFADGPLNKLYKDKFKNNIYQFPADLGQDNRGHVIMFTVQKSLEPNQQGVFAERNVQQIIDTFASVGITGLNISRTNILTPEGRQQITDLSRNLSAEVRETLRSSIDALTSGLRKEDGDSIALYVPDTVNVQYAAQYSDLSLSNALGKPLFLAQAGASVYNKVSNDQSAAKNISNVANDPFVRASISGLIERALNLPNLQQITVGNLGYAFNPQLQVLFSSIDPREFQFDFVLTPKNAKEAAEVQNIIRTFKKAAAPEFQPGFITGQSVFMKVPDSFKIKFLYNGQENLNVNRIGDCVLKNIDIDYSPNGWSTFKDGSAVQTRLTLQFREVFIIDKNRINEGY